jgi:hypothetical protein
MMRFIGRCNENPNYCKQCSNQLQSVDFQVLYSQTINTSQQFVTRVFMSRKGQLAELPLDTIQAKHLHRAVHTAACSALGPHAHNRARS